MVLYYCIDKKENKEKYLLRKDKEGKFYIPIFPIDPSKIESFMVVEENVHTINSKDEYLKFIDSLKNNSVDYSLKLIVNPLVDSWSIIDISTLELLEFYEESIDKTSMILNDYIKEIEIENSCLNEDKFQYECLIKCNDNRNPIASTVIKDFEKIESRKYNKTYRIIWEIINYFEVKWNSGYGIEFIYDIDVIEDWLYINSLKIYSMEHILGVADIEDENSISLELMDNKVLKININNSDCDNIYISQIAIINPDNNSCQLLFEKIY